MVLALRPWPWLLQHSSLAGRMLLISRRKCTLHSLAHSRIQNHLLPRKRRVSASIVNGFNANENIQSTVVNLNVAPSSSTSFAHNFTPPNIFLVWGAAATAATVSIFGLEHADSFGSRDNQYHARGYHSTVTTCESNRSGNKPPNENKVSDDESESSSNFFFDMAQQYLARELSRNESPSGVENKKRSPNSSNTTSNQPTEEQVHLDIFEGNIDGQANNAFTNNEHDIQNSVKEDKEHDSSNDFQRMMNKVLFKFDEIPSSNRNKSSSQTNEDSNNAGARGSRMPSDDKRTDNVNSMFSDFLSFANNASLFTRKSSQATSHPDIEELIQQAQRIANHMSSSDNSPTQDPSESGFLSQVFYFQKNAQAIRRAFETSFAPLLSNVNAKELFQSLPFAAVHYYLEHEDSIKTPSWKRRRHRFQRAVEVAKVEELNEALSLSELSYADSVDEIRKGMESLHGNDGKHQHKPRWELLFCDIRSRPHRPSHFLAIQKNASAYDDTLRVLLVVRGTKSMSDLITDAMMEATDYEYRLPGEEEGENNVIRGKAHGGMVASGKYLVERHQKLLRTLLKLSKKRKLEITLIGHSLGAGAATIAAMEWNTNPSELQSDDDKGSRRKSEIQLSAHVIGFGCPATLSRSLSLATRPYVTSVVADADFIPRMSGVTLVNLLLDIRRFDYRSRAERDVEQALVELRSRYFAASTSDDGPRSSHEPTSMGKRAFRMEEEDIQTVMGYVRRGLEKVATTSQASSAEKISQKSQDGVENNGDDRKKEVEKMQPVLFPPGECIHFYRDGSGISGAYVPCNFFNEIDVARTMIEDHLISSGYRKIFLNLMRDFHKDDHFSFESNDIDK